ncbi:MAG: ribonuclease III [Rickettsiales bacterium]|jgi:ribonuclease III|nr:ribonuclease III [Rickettsiales bacterium]|tara:strand:- start:1332 stop:2015 length:684 start_codon:yes stop_codon:yes gene_type:complete
MSNLKNFTKKISYNFINQKYLEEALTHPSFSKEKSNNFNYQRLEFLGDKILSLIITNYLFKKYPHEKEGELSRRHAVLVSGEIISKVGKAINIQEFLKMSDGEINLGGKENDKNIENAVEALIAAIYLDSGYDEAENFILTHWKFFLDQYIIPPKDPVSKLQEMIQLKSKDLPIYIIEKVGGSDHKPEFCATLEVKFLNKKFSANGNSKKQAQKNVAIIALEEIIEE